MNPLDADRAYCRAVLPRVSRTFAINIRLLGGSMGEAVRVAYLLCRIADTLEDAWPGEPEAIERHFDTFLAAVSGDHGAGSALAAEAARHPARSEDLGLVANLPRVLAGFGALASSDQAAILEAVRIMARGMSRYASRAAQRGATASAPVAYLEDAGELHDYCWIVAGCVGVMLTRLFTARSPAPSAAIEARRFERAPVVGEALQLTNILLDWPSDVRRGRCHVPAAWLAEFGLAPSDLVGASRPGLAEIRTRLEALAIGALARVPEYLDALPASSLRFRLFCLWPALWARDSLLHARQDPEFPWGPHRPRMPKDRLWRTALGSLLAPHGRALARGAALRP